MYLIAAIGLILLSVVLFTSRADMQVDISGAQASLDEALATAKQELSEKCATFTQLRNQWETLNDSGSTTQVADAKEKMDEAFAACTAAYATIEARGAEAKQALADAKQKLQELMNTPTAAEALKAAAQSDATNKQNSFNSARDEIRGQYEKLQQDFSAKLAQYQSTNTDALKMDLEERKKQLEALRSARFENACALLNSSQTVPAGYGASFDLLSTHKELLLKMVCDPESNSALMEVGNGSANQYVYNKGYQWKDGSWQQLSFSPAEIPATPDQNWIQGKGVTELKFNPQDVGTTQYVVGYTCTWTGTEWKCGCSDQACTTGKWQMQQVKPQ